MVEFPQSVPNLTEASTNLYEIIKGRNLTCYADDDIRLSISRAVAIETSRGWRIAKEKQSHKIDVVVALAQAALGAVLAQGGDGFLNYARTMAQVARGAPNPYEHLADDLMEIYENGPPRASRRFQMCKVRRQARADDGQRRRGQPAAASRVRAVISRNGNGNDLSTIPVSPRRCVALPRSAAPGDCSLRIQFLGPPPAAGVSSAVRQRDSWPRSTEDSASECNAASDCRLALPPDHRGVSVGHRAPPPSPYLRVHSFQNAEIARDCLLN
jgi:hypothetical protein